MSINVTVTGNPISIEKGKMVTTSPNHSKREFERRRLIRLSQVRQQSKNIAEEVRNRVRQQKLKQVEEIEKEGQRKLKQWQARKLLELQNQYHDALRDLGTGHKEASKLEDEKEILNEKEENNLRTAKLRGKIATEKLNEGKEKQKLNSSLPIQKKILVRDIENKRAKMIANVKKSSESFRKKNDVEILSTETEVSGIVTESDSDDEDIEKTVIVSKNKKDLTQNSNLEKKECENSVSNVVEENNAQNTENNISSVKPAENSAPPEYVPNSDEELLQEIRRDQTDTRISDRIRKRASNRSDACDTFSRPPETRSATVNCQTLYPTVQQNVYACACRPPPPTPNFRPCHCANAPPPQRKADVIADIDQLKCVDFTDEDEEQARMKSVKKDASRTSINKAPSKKIAKEIPTKPKVTLRSVKSPSRISEVASSVSKRAEKINEEGILISSETVAEVDFQEKIRQQDREALLRGQKAMEKQRLQREYEELMKKLPALQKLERLSEMNKDKPEYHMTEDRLKEQEKKKQSVLDNTYERLFPDKRPPKKITLPIKGNQERTNEESDEDSITLNLGVLDMEKRSRPKLYTSKQVQDIIRQGKLPSENKIRKDQLKSILVSLRKQKEELLREIQDIPDDSQSLTELFGLTDEKETEVKCATKSDNLKLKFEKKVKKERVKTSANVEDSKGQVRTGTSTSSSVELQKRSRTVKTSSKAVQTGKSLTESEVTKPKTAKKRKNDKEILLSSSENLSSKKTIDNNSKSSSKRPRQQMDVETPTKVPSAPVNSLVSLTNGKKIIKSVNCDCKKELTQAKKSGELCEIVIKIKDGKSSEIHVKENKETRVNNADKNNKKEIVKIVKTKELDRKKEIEDAMKDGCCSLPMKSSWGEHFSKNNNSVQSNSSTSYMSPPQFVKAPSDFCRRKQTLSTPPTKLKGTDDGVLVNIDKLLTMSRLSVDELGVSSVSSVTTPSQSVLEIESNKPPQTSTGARSELAGARSELTGAQSELTGARSELTSARSEAETYRKYAKIADQCNQRITRLTERIQRVRDEKDRILQNVTLLTNNTDEISTKYMDLPSGDKDELDGSNSSGSSSSEMNRLLEIDMSLAAKLKKMSPEEIEKMNKSSKLEENQQEIDLAARLRALKGPLLTNKDDVKETQAPPNDKAEENVDFVPFLLNIPKFPPLHSEVSNVTSKHRKPPPSKSFLAARKMTEDFAAPHELSTIPEQDSQLRFEGNKTEISKSEALNDKVKRGENDERTMKLKLTPPSMKESRMNYSDNNNSSSNEEKIEMFRMEAMLRSIGMEWAIATLRKTQETLALTSSSCSSIDKASATVKELDESELKEFLGKHNMIQKISSSTLRSEASPGSLNESQELSDIVNDSFSKKQTSTPNNLSRKLDKSSDMPSGIGTDKEAQVFYSFTDDTL